MIHSFLLVGQSNMAGRGFIKDAIPVNSENILTLRNGHWYPMFRPICPDKDTAGVSLAESFAERYAEKHNVKVGLICCADGGTTLDQWKPGDLRFDNAINQAKMAQRQSTIVGILWHQGEFDCKDSLYPIYRQKFENIMNEFRRQLDLPDVPFIVGGLGDYLLESKDNFMQFYNAPHVNKTLQEIVADNDRMGYVSAEGLTCNSDRLHFDSKSLYEFGIRYFNEYEKVAERNNFIAKEFTEEVVLPTGGELL